MNLGPFQDTPFDNEEAFNDFLLANEASHTSIRSALARAGSIIDAVPLSGSPYDDKQWLIDHYSEHLQIANALKLTGLPDLADIDLEQEDAFQNFMQLHTLVHSQINIALGI